MILPPASVRKVALVGYDDVQSLDLTGPLEVFTMANRLGAVAAYEVILASPVGGEIRTSSGLRLSGAVALSALPEDLDTLLVAGGDEIGLLQLQDSAIVAWLADAAARIRRVGSVCTGAFVLAAAGLLDGRRATTHWASCERLARFRPRIEIEPDAIFVADPPVFTSAGVTAGIDLCLSFVESDLGPEIALAVARNLVLFMRRPGGQSQFSASLNIQLASNSRLRALLVEIAQDPAGDLRLAAMAERASMTERTFSRAFRRETGLTPAAFVEAARIDRAKAFLESSQWPLSRVAERAGFNSLDTMHRAFQKKLGATPSEFRRRFGR